MPSYHPNASSRPGTPGRRWQGILLALCALFALVCSNACFRGNLGTPLTITTAASVSAGATGCTASIPAQSAGATYAWSIRNGTLTAGQGTRSITYTAGSPGTALLTVLVTYPLGAPAQAQATVRVLPSPTITSFTAARATLSAGGATTLTAVFADGTGTVSQLGGITSGTPLATGTLTASTTYTLTVTNSLGATATAQATVAVVDAPSITRFTAAKGTLTAGTGTTLDYAFSGGSATIDGGVGAVTSGGSSTVTPTASTTYTLTVTNAAGDSATAQAAVAVVAAPSITSFAAAKATLTAGKATTLAAVFANGTGSVSALGSIASGTPLATGTLTASTTYTLTVTNAAGDSATAQAAVAVVDAPSITSFAAAKATLTAGHGTILGCTYSGGTGTVDQGVGPVASGGTCNVAPAADTTYTLTVTNAAGDSATATASVAVVAAPTITSFTAASNPVVRGATASVTGTFSNGTATLSQSVQSVAVTVATRLPAVTSGTATGLGTVTSGTAVTTPALAAPTTYTLTVTNAAGDAATASIPITFAPLFTATGSLNVARTHHTATLLKNGKVLIAGGNDLDGTALSSAELYDPAKGTFTPTATSMIQPRFCHVAVLLVDGTVLIADGGSTAVAEIYDPASDSFRATGARNIDSCSFPTATLLSDQAGAKVLIAGGIDVSSFQVVSDAEIYNPASGTFTVVDNLVHARNSQTANLLANGAVLLAGGGSDSAAQGSAELFTTRFVSTGNMNKPRSDHTATFLPDGTVLMAGGASTATAEIFDPSLGTFTLTGVMSAVRQRHTATLLADGTVLVAGGTSSGSYLDDLASAECFTPSAGTFASTGALGTGREFHTATLLPNGGVLVVGGTGVTGRALASAEIYR